MPLKLVSCIVLCLSFRVIICSAAAAPVKPLAVVHSWGDLLAQQPVTIEHLKTYGDNSSANPRPSFKIGIDRTESKCHDRAIIYCLIQGDSGLHDSGENHHVGFGPFGITIERPDHVTTRSPHAFVGFVKISQPMETVLYMASIPLDLEGDYTILVQGQASDPNPKDATFQTIATARIKVCTESAAVWIPWVMPPKVSQRWLEARNSTIEVAIPSGGPALPSCPGWVPIPKLPDMSRVLPELIGTTIDSGVQLTLNANELILKLDDEVFLTFEDDCFLTRWWVNGKPFIPKLDRPQRNWGFAHSGPDSSYKELHFKMEFDPDVLCLKKGDIVGVQLLECSPQGWEYVRTGDGLPPHGCLCPNKNPLIISRLSNRIDFIYSGDPKEFAQRQPTH